MNEKTKNILITIYFIIISASVLIFGKIMHDIIDITPWFIIPGSIIALHAVAGAFLIVHLLGGEQ